MAAPVILHLPFSSCLSLLAFLFLPFSSFFVGKYCSLLFLSLYQTAEDQAVSMMDITSTIKTPIVATYDLFDELSSFAVEVAHVKRHVENDN